MRRILASAATLAVLTACGSSAPTAAPSTSRPSPTPTAPPTATPAPDVQRIDVVSTGVGSWQLVSVPVAVIRNTSTQSIAINVFVHLTPTAGGRPLTPLVTPALTLFPSQALVVAANCTDTCVGADGATATVTPGTWTPKTGAPVTATVGAIACRVSCQGRGQWDVPVTIGSPALGQNEQVDLFASCVNAAGQIIGGGQRTLLWPHPGGTLDLHVPVIVTTPPVSCEVGATTSN